jgi:DNA-binding NarL/FixJ family response regulator
MRDFLENETSFKVCGEAVDGYDAIQKAKDLNPDLIILDFSMPKMNGIEAARVLKKILPQTPIVMLTSHHPSVLGYDTHAVGIDGCRKGRRYGCIAWIAFKACCKKPNPRVAFPLL